MPLGREVVLRPTVEATRGPCSSNPQKGGRAPSFRPMSIVGKRLDGSRWHLACRYSVSPGHIVLDGEPAPPPKRGKRGQSLTPPKCSAYVWPNGLMWIKMPLGIIKVGLCPCHIVLDGNPAPPAKRGTVPNFRPRLLWPNGRSLDGSRYHLVRR